MDRRNFLVGSIAAAAAGTVLVADGCSAPGVSVVPGASAAQYTLTVGYANYAIQGYQFQTRTYNGSSVGPTLVAQPGTMLSVNVVNKLPPNPSVVVPQGAVCVPNATTRHMMTAAGSQPAVAAPAKSGTRSAMQIDLMNNPNNFNTTNLHVHGIQTTPHLYNPIGTSNALSQMIAIEPGQSFTYTLPVPANQPGGLYWYHPHHHGSTDVQVSGGMAGLIIVPGPIDQVPEIAAARDLHMAIQTLNVNQSASNPNLYNLEYVAYAPPPLGYQPGANFMMTTVNGQGVNWANNTVNTSGNVPGAYTNFPPPVYTMQPGEVVRLRILNGSNFMYYPLVLPNMNVYIIAQDGVNYPAPVLLNQANTTMVTPANLFDGTTIEFPPGSRVELLIQAPQTPGTYNLTAVATTNVSFQNFPAFTFAQFVVSGTPLDMAIPATLPLPSREYPLIAASDVQARHSVTFSEGPAPQILFDFGFFINGQLFDETAIDTYASLGTAAEWTVSNTSSEFHPFHMHVNSVQVVAINGAPLATPLVRDTMTVPPQVGNTPGSVTLRIRFDQFAGKTVYHCHILPHEDTGMMQNFIIA